MDEILVETTNIKKVFSGVVAIEGIDFQLQKGEVHALMGENGAGKSTLSKIIAGIYQADGGTMRVSGREVRFANVREAVAHGVSIVTQEFSLIPDLSIAENIFLADDKYYKYHFLADKRAMAEQTRSLLALFGMEHTIDPYAKVAQLSVGLGRLLPQIDHGHGKAGSLPGEGPHAEFILLAQPGLKIVQQLLYVEIVHMIPRFLI